MKSCSPRRSDALPVLLRSLDLERVLPELLPAPICRPQDVHRLASHRARAAPDDLPRPGRLVSVPPRIRHPPSAAPRVLRHATRSALAPLLPRCAADDASHQASLRRLCIPARGARTSLRRRLPGMEAPRRDARPVLGDADRLGRALLGALLRVRDALVAVGAPALAVGPRPDPRGDRQLVRPQIRLPELPEWRRLAQHPGLRHGHHGRALPEQPPQVPDEPRLRGALVRDRSHLAGDEGSREDRRDRDRHAAAGSPSGAGDRRGLRTNQDAQVSSETATSPPSLSAFSELEAGASGGSTYHWRPLSCCRLSRPCRSIAWSSRLKVEKPWSRSSKSGSLRTIVSLISEGFKGPVARESRLDTTSRAICGIFLSGAVCDAAPRAPRAARGVVARSSCSSRGGAFSLRGGFR